MSGRLEVTRRRVRLLVTHPLRSARHLLGRAKRLVLTMPRRLAAAAGMVATLAARARWRAVVACLVVFGVRLRRVVGAPASDSIPVIMCVWSRPHRIVTTLDALAEQKDSPPLRLILWNNRRADDQHYLAAIEEFGVRGALASVEFFSSRVNIGGIARFVAARSITRGKSDRPFVMLDDDLDVSPSFVRDLLAAYAPATYAGWWAFNILGGYWEREPTAPGQPATYVGTGASICDSRMVHTRGFFARLPDRFGFIEDLWASAFANSRGWRVIKVDTPVEMTSEDSNQYLALVDSKVAFWDRLHERLEEGKPL